MPWRHGSKPIHLPVIQVPTHPMVVITAAIRRPEVWQWHAPVRPSRAR